MRRTLLLPCAVGLCGTLAVMALANGPIGERPRGSAQSAATAAVPESGPFALAATRAQSEASAERRRAARAAYSTHESGEYRPSTAPHGTRIRVISRVAARLGVGRRAMWRAVSDVRRRISPREWSDARNEALRMLARELDRPLAEVQRAVHLELREAGR